jgi:hypothetical protein
MAPNLEASGPELLMDAWCPVEATMTIENRPHLARERLVFPSPSAWVQVPLTPGIEAAAGHSQLLAQPGHRKAVRQGLDQAKPLGGSCSLAKCAAASLKKSFSLRDVGPKN